MKFTNYFLLILAILAAGCTNDKDATVPVNEAEYITTVQLVFTGQAPNSEVVLTFKDLDGEGANAPIITVSKPFKQNTTYRGNVLFRNDLAVPAQDITPEILSEALDHQLFYQTTGTLNPFEYNSVKSNFDKNGKPVGLQCIFKTTGAAAGILRVSLRHGPNKNAANVSSGNIANAGGATDIEVNFPVRVE